MGALYERYSELKSKRAMMEEDSEIFAGIIGQFRTEVAADLCIAASLRFDNYLDSIKEQLREVEQELRNPESDDPY